MAASALDFVPTGTNAETLPANLTERRFRHFWEQTDKSRGAALAVARSTRLSMPAPRSVEIVTQSASGIVFAMLKVRRHAVSPSTVGTLPWHSGQRMRRPLSRRIAFSSVIACQAPSF